MYEDMRGREAESEREIECTDSQILSPPRHFRDSPGAIRTPTLIAIHTSQRGQLQTEL